MTAFGNLIISSEFYKYSLQMNYQLVMHSSKQIFQGQTFVQLDLVQPSQTLIMQLQSYIRYYSKIYKQFMRTFQFIQLICQLPVKHIMSIKIFCVFLFLFSSIAISQSCLLPRQLPGNCSSCFSTQLLQNANCYEKLRGCLDQLESRCAKCQNGYVLLNSACIKEAEYYNITTLAPPPSTIIDSTLNMSAIQPILVGGYTKTTNFGSLFYLSALNQLYLDYPNLKPFTIADVQEQVVSGMNYMISLVDEKLGDSYRAQIYVKLNKQATVGKVYKNQNLISLAQNQTNSQVQNGSIPGGWDIFTNYTDQRYLDSKNALFTSYPLLDSYNITKVQYQVVAGLNFLFYLQRKNDLSTFVAEVFNPLYGNVKILNTWQNSTTISSNNLAGGFQLKTGNYSSDANYVSAYNAVISSYPQLKNSIVTQVQEQVVAGMNYIIDFKQTNSSDVYKVKVYVPLVFTQQPPSIEYILKNGQNYSSKANLNVQSPQKINSTSPQVGNYQDQDSNYTSNPNYLSALSALKTAYPVLNNAVVTKVQEQIVAGVNYIISFQQNNSTNTFQAKIFVPLPYTKLPPQIRYILKNGANYTNPNSNPPLTSTNSSTTNQAGGYQVINDYATDQNYIAALATAKNAYPILNNCSVTRVQQQVVAGVKFIISFQQSNSTNTFQVKVFVPLAYTQQAPQIDYILKNGQSYPGVIGTSPSSIGEVYNWQTDSVFNSLYDYFKVQANIVNFTPIIEVQRSNKSNQNIQYFQYRIIYSTYQYAIVRYYPQINKFKVASYMADGTNIYQLGKSVTPLLQKNQYIIQSSMSSISSAFFGNALIQGVKYIALQPVFSVYIVTATIKDGTYRIKILDDGSVIPYNTLKINNSTCFEINDTQSSVATHQQYVRDQLVIYLKSKYNFSDYETTLSMVNFNINNTIDYRILFARSDYKQVVVKIQGVSDKYTIKELSLLYDGLAIVNSSSPLSINITNLARNSIYSSVLKTAELVAVKFNGQKYQLTFADSSRLYNYTYFNSSSSITLQSTIFSGTIPCQNTTNTLCKSCPQNALLWLEKCYIKLQNCNVQAGSICVICSKDSILIEGKCASNCQKIFS